MLNYVIKRLLGMIPTLFIVSVLVFLFVHMLPGDPARLIAGPEADAQVIELVRQQLGLDQPLYHQFWHYISNAVQGDFGLSMVSRRPVADEIDRKSTRPELQSHSDLVCRLLLEKKK